MRFPDGLTPDENPGGFPFARFQIGAEIIAIRGRFDGDAEECHCLEIRDFPRDCQMLFGSCWDFFVPPLILAGKDVCLKYHRHSVYRGQLSMDSLERDFERAVRFYVEENRIRAFPLVRVIDSDGDVELPADYWVWVIEYYPEESKAAVINIEKFRDRLPVCSLDVSVAYLESRFPSVPNYSAIPSRQLPRDVLPRSLRD